VKYSDYKRKLKEWEADGYDVSELKDKWFPRKDRRIIALWFTVCIVIIISASLIIIPQWNHPGPEPGIPEPGNTDNSETNPDSPKITPVVPTDIIKITPVSGDSIDIISIFPPHNTPLISGQSANITVEISYVLESVSRGEISLRWWSGNNAKSFARYVVDESSGNVTIFGTLTVPDMPNLTISAFLLPAQISGRSDILASVTAATYPVMTP
jgi:hypothetical protein